MMKSWKHKFSIILAITLSAIFIISIGYTLIKHQWGRALIPAATQTGVFIPFIANHFTKKKGVSIPSEGIIVYLLAIFLTYYLGDFCKIYFKLGWWDSTLHFISGFVLTIAGFYIINIFNVKAKGALVTNSLFIALFSLCFANTLGIVWEIGEYISDISGLTKEAQSGLDDTMIDIILNMAGSIITAVVYYVWRKKKLSKMN